MGVRIPPNARFFASMGGHIPDHPFLPPSLLQFVVRFQWLSRGRGGGISYVVHVGSIHDQQFGHV